MMEQLSIPPRPSPDCLRCGTSKDEHLGRTHAFVDPAEAQAAAIILEEAGRGQLILLDEPEPSPVVRLLCAVQGVAS
jgi:hypothetical protein